MRVWACLAIILANFIAQVPYFLHLYARTQAFLIDLRSFLIMGAVFAFFLAGVLLFLQRRVSGFWLLNSFLLIEFLFYLFSTVHSVLNGFPLFFQVANPDLILRAVYSIGYLNLFASGYCLFVLIQKRTALFPSLA